MEVKINKEIREYTESIAFGLSLRQCFFSTLACILAVILYFAYVDRLGVEITGWICMVAALPCAALGFIKYQGMNAERIAIEAVRSFILTRRTLINQPINNYYLALQSLIRKQQKEEIEKHDKKFIKITKIKQRWISCSKKCARHH